MPVLREENRLFALHSQDRKGRRAPRPQPTMTEKGADPQSRNLRGPKTPSSPTGRRLRGSKTPPSPTRRMRRGSKTPSSPTRIQVFVGLGRIYDPHLASDCLARIKNPAFPQIAVGEGGVFGPGKEMGGCGTPWAIWQRACWIRAALRRGRGWRLFRYRRAGGPLP